MHPPRDWPRSLPSLLTASALLATTAFAQPSTPATPGHAGVAARPVRVVGWIPYWRRAEGADIAAEHIESFDCVSPFAYEVQADGTLRDKMSRRAAQWQRLRDRARAQGTSVIPSLAWMSGQEMHAILSDTAARAAHIDRIVALVREERFDGIDIDYEGKDVADREHFSAFLRELAPLLDALDADLVCTVEGRATEEPPADANYGQRMPFAVDYRVLGEVCDEVRLMAYGQWFLENGEREFQTDGAEPYAPNTDVRWAEQVVRYAQRHVPSERILLGVPTHGRLFELGGQAGAWTYRSRGATHHARVHELATLPSARLDRPDSGELRLRYGHGARRRVVYLSDATTLQARIELAQRLGIAGVALFKIDGREDPGIWDILAAARSVTSGR